MWRSLHPGCPLEAILFKPPHESGEDMTVKLAERFSSSGRGRRVSVARGNIVAFLLSEFALLEQLSLHPSSDQIGLT